MIIKRLLVTLFALLIPLSIGALSTQAQDKIVLTVEMPQFMGDTYNSAYFDPFRAAHPGVDVVVTLQDNSQLFPPSPVWDSLDKHLNSVSGYTASADVLFIYPDTFMTQESTRAGYWRDLKPLVLADPDLAEANFYPVAWRAYQWDGGMWALPTHIRLNLFTYDPADFDKAGLTYPDEHWTIDTFADAAIALTERDKDGAPTKPGCFCDEKLLFYSFLGGGFKDANDDPLLDTPELATLLDTWSPVNQQIYPADPNGISSQGVPMQMAGTHTLVVDAREPMAAARLPGKLSSASIEGFGVSAGSIHPDLAFDLVKFLAQNPRIVYGSPGQYPGLRTANSVNDENFNNFPPQNQVFIDEALENAVGGADLLFYNYIFVAENQMRQEGIDAATALNNAQAKALANLEAASQWTGAQDLMVATPAPTASFGAEEIVLRFGISQQQVTNPADWERVAQEFAETDPQVGKLVIEYQGFDYETFMDNNDCYYLTYTAVDPYRVPEYINLDPYVNADPAFIPADFLPGTLERMQLGGKTWGYPLSMQPVVLLYNHDTFEKAGIPQPGTTWTTSEFSDAIQTLQSADLGIPAFSTRYAENADWLILIAAYGGLPIDYRTEPPTINFTEHDTVTAIRQVLDMAKSGAIQYSKLGTFSYMDMPGPGAISATQLNGYVDFMKEFNSVNFPQGRSHQTMGLGDVGGMYISQHAQNPDACYRWMATVAAHPELLPGLMPTRTTAINEPVLLAAQGAHAVSMYQEFARLLAAPNTIIFHSGFGGGGVYSVEMFYVNQWLDRAFDAYVLNDENLESALANAQSKAADFISCVNKVPALSNDASEAELTTYYDGVSNCVKLVDPAMAAEQEALASGS